MARKFFEQPRLVGAFRGKCLGIQKECFNTGPAGPRKRKRTGPVGMDERYFCAQPPRANRI